eukprot:XP_001702607.1 predicted protein [Chlamydomonas reinhardtii]
MNLLASTMVPLAWDTEGKAFSGALASPGGLGYVLALVRASNGSRMLVPVCDRGWNDDAARVACNLGGFRYGAAVPTGGATGRAQITTLSLAPMFDVIECYPAVGTTNATAAFATCYGTWYQWGTCNGVAAVICSNGERKEARPKPGKKPTKKPTPSPKPSPSPAPATVTAKFVNKASVSTCASNAKASNICSDVEVVVDSFVTATDLAKYPSMCFRVVVKKTTTGCGSAAGLQELRIPTPINPSCDDLTLNATVNDVPASLVATCIRDEGMQYMAVSLAGLTAAQLDGAKVCVEDVPAVSWNADLQNYFLDMATGDLIPGSETISGSPPGTQFSTSYYYHTVSYAVVPKGSAGRCYKEANATYVASKSVCIPNESEFQCSAGGAMSGCAKQQTSSDCGDGFKKCGFDVRKGHSIAAFAAKNAGGCSKCLSNKEFGYCYVKGPTSKDMFSYCCSL